jgi:hypothetical protein
LGFDNFEVWYTTNCFLQQGYLDRVCQGELIRVLLIEVELFTPVGNKVFVGSSPILSSYQMYEGKHKFAQVSRKFFHV